MGLRARLLRMTAENGPRKRSVLLGVAGRYKNGEAIMERMIAQGALVLYGSKRGSTWGSPGWKPAGKARQGREARQ